MCQALLKNSKLLKTGSKVLFLFISVFTILFISIGGYIYYVNNILNIRKSSKEREIETVEWEKKYKKFENYAQPRIVSVNVNVDIFPSTRALVPLENTLW